MYEGVNLFNLNTERQRELFHLLAHSPDANSSQRGPGWRCNLEVRPVLPRGWGRPEHMSCHLPACEASRGAGRGVSSGGSLVQESGQQVAPQLSYVLAAQSGRGGLKNHLAFQELWSTVELLACRHCPFDAISIVDLVSNQVIKFLWSHFCVQKGVS